MLENGSIRGLGFYGCVCYVRNWWYPWTRILWMCLMLETGGISGLGFYGCICYVRNWWYPWTRILHMGKLFELVKFQHTAPHYITYLQPGDVTSVSDPMPNLSRQRYSVSTERKPHSSLTSNGGLVFLHGTQYIHLFTDACIHAYYMPQRECRIRIYTMPFAAHANIDTIKPMRRGQPAYIKMWFHLTCGLCLEVKVKVKVKICLFYNGQ